MKKIEVVKKKEEFNLIIQTCRFFKNNYFTIYIRKREQEISRFGLAISKKVGNAVTRNHLKRQIRALVDKNKDIFSKSCDYIIMIKKECNNATFQQLEENLIKLIKEKKWN